MSLWKRITGAKSPVKPTVQKQMASALAALDPAYSSLGKLLTVARKYRNGNPELALECTQEALTLVQLPMEAAAMDRAAVLYEHSLTSLFSDKIFTGGAFFEPGGILVTGILTSDQKIALPRHYDLATKAFMQYPSYGYPGEHAFELCGTLVSLAWNNQNEDLHTSWQPIKEVFYKSRGECDVEGLIRSIDENQSEADQKMENLFFERRQQVSEAAYKFARQAGVVPAWDPVCIYSL